MDLRSWLSSPIAMSMLALYGLYALSLIWSISPEGGNAQLETKFGLAFIPLLLWTHRSVLTRQKIDRLLGFFVQANAVVLVLALLRAGYRALEAGGSTFLNVYGNPISFFTYSELAYPFMHPGYLATHFGMALFILLFSVLDGSGSIMKKALQALFLLAGMVLLQGRINLLALMIVLGIWALVRTIRMRRPKWLLIPLVPIALLGMVLLWAPDNVGRRYLQFPDFSYDISGDQFNSATYRLAEWNCAWETIQERPLLGSGIGGNNAALWQVYNERGFHKGLEGRFNAHNQFLETWITIGTIGLILLLGMLLIHFRHARKKDDDLYFYTLLFFVLCLVTESMFERAWAIILFSTIFPLLALRSAKN